MSDFRSIVNYQTGNYGEIKIKLEKLLKDKGITRNYLRTLTGVKYEVIDRYYKANNVEMVDLNFLSKVCYVLDCKIEDILEYQEPEKI